MGWRVVCVDEVGGVGRHFYCDEVRAVGEWRHCRRVPSVVFAGLFGPGARGVQPVRVYLRPDVMADAVPQI